MANPDQDKLGQRLRDDAMQIDANVSPELQQRIAASIHSAKQLRSVGATSDRGKSYWWASSLTGVTAALLVILLVNWNRNDTIDLPESPVAVTITPEISESLVRFPLNARTADLTGPLEEELRHLQTDLEKARETVERDLRTAL